MKLPNDTDKENLWIMKQRILDISYRHKLSHLGSNLTALPILYEIYSVKKKNDPFILSSGHAGLALYTILEHFEGVDAEYLFNKHGVHPNRDIEHGIYASTGSLGQGLPIAVGMALATKNNVYCLISDGELSEGSIWESLNIIKDFNIDNIKVFLNYNGFGAYRQIKSEVLERLRCYDLNIRHTNVNQYPFLKDQAAHYYTMSEQDYQSTLKRT